jgi:hypothetical protein
MASQVTILEGIIDEIKLALFQKWVNNVPQDQQSDESLAPLAANAAETTIFVIQMYMDKINEAAEQLQNQD